MYIVFQYVYMYNIYIRIWTCWCTVGLVHVCMPCMHANTYLRVEVCIMYKYMDLLVHGGLGAAHDDVVLF